MSLKDKIKISRALKFATKKHKGQFRAGGDEYITHPLAVCGYVKAWGYGADFQICALFHDLLEDTDATESEILKLGGKDVLDAVKALSKKPGYVMREYIDGIKKNEMAKVVKTADRIHNLKCATVTNDDFKRRYIEESRRWYADFSPEISTLADKLEKTLDTV